MEYALTDRISILHLSKERIAELRHIKLKELPFDPDDNSIWTLKTINVDNIVGVYRPMHAKTWIEMLDYKSCHKNKNFMLFQENGLAEFTKFLLNPPSDDLPMVIEYNNEYYIAGEGLHRLTIAKCIGNMKATVAVTKITSYS